MNNDAPISLRVIVLCGGSTAEREVSLESGRCVHAALRSLGVDSTLVALTDDDISGLEGLEFEVIFNAIHGAFGEDGFLQRLCAEKGYLLTGCGAEACELTFNKVLTKKAFDAHNLPTPDWTVVSAQGNYAQGNYAQGNYAQLIQEAGLTIPYIVKPVCGGSSQGINLVRDPAQLPDAIAAAAEYDDEILIEKLIVGRELTVGVLEDSPLPVLEVRTKRDFYDYQAKYEDDDTEYICPAEISAEVTARIQGFALAANRSVGIEEFSRVDVMLDHEGNAYVIEINAIPGFTTHSLLPKADAAAGIDFPHLCLKIIELAWMR